MLILSRISLAFCRPGSVLLRLRISWVTRASVKVARALGGIFIKLSELFYFNSNLASLTYSDSFRPNIFGKHSLASVQASISMVSTHLTI